MVRYYVCYEIYGDRRCLEKLEEFCNERGLIFEYRERYDTDSYADYRETANNEFGYEDSFTAWLTFKNIPNREQILSELNDREDIDIWIKIDM